MRLFGRAKKQSILIVSDEPLVLAELKQELKDHFDVSIAATGSIALSALRVPGVSAVLICISPNRETAFGVFAEIHDSVKSAGIPVIFLAEKGNDDDETAAFALGAADYSARRQGTSGALVNRIKLRVRAAEHERHSARAHHDRRASTPENALAGKAILVADDVELNRDLIAAMLSEIPGLSLDFAEDGKGALDLFSSDPARYALIFMDVHMPGMDGLDATRAIRALGSPQARDVPIVAVTASNSEGEVAQFMKAGMNGFIEKPMDYRSLLAIISEHCL